MKRGILILCFLLGMTGFVFLVSYLWDSNWWLWHLFRLIAYVIALLYVVILYRRNQNEIKETYGIINMSPAVAFLWKNEEEWPAEFVTSNVEALFGYTAEEFLTGKITYSNVVHPEVIMRSAFILLSSIRVLEYLPTNRNRFFRHFHKRMAQLHGNSAALALD